MTSEEKVARGYAAERLMSDPLLTEAFEILESSFTTAWKTSKRGDVETREEAYRSLSNLIEIKAYLGRVISTGKTEQKLLDKAKEAAQRAARALRD